MFKDLVIDFIYIYIYAASIHAAVLIVFVIWTEEKNISGTEQKQQNEQLHFV